MAEKAFPQIQIERIIGGAQIRLAKVNEVLFEMGESQDHILDGPLRAIATETITTAARLCRRCPLMMKIEGRHYDTVVGRKLMGHCTGFERPKRGTIIQISPAATVTFRELVENDVGTARPVKGLCGVVPEKLFMEKPPVFEQPRLL